MNFIVPLLLVIITVNLLNMKGKYHEIFGLNIFTEYVT